MEFLGCHLNALVPAAVHITTRKKFDVYLPGADKSNQDVSFVINIDRVNAKDLVTNTGRRYTDIDISGIRPVNGAELVRLIRFTERISAQFDLIPNRATKAAHDLGLVPELLEKD